MADEVTTDRIIAYWNERVARYQTREEATLLDHNMRALEIETACSWLEPSDRVLDLFCANALTTVELSRACHSVVGLDLADGMIAAAREQLAQKGVPPAKVSVRQGNVVDLPAVVSRGEFDTVVTIRGLINLPTRELQEQALRSIHDILPSGGKLIFLEGSKDGLDAINRLRARFSLEPLQEPWYDKHFDSGEFFKFVEPLFEVEATRSLDPYFLLSRVLYPLAAAPEEPRFDHPCNAMARMAVPFMKTDEGTTLLICAKMRKRG